MIRTLASSKSIDTKGWRLGVNTLKTPVTISLAILSLAATQQLRAQSQLEEVVVTAEKREQSVQDVPLSVTAFTGQSIRELGLTRPSDIANQVPGVTMKSPNGDNSPIFTIRGIGLTDFTVSNNSATTVYVDQVSKPYYPMVNFALFDLERVEVLKGPQGTLYGRNNTGGAITFFTRKPSQESEGFVRMDYGRYDTWEIEAAAGGGLSENLAARFATFTRQREEGYQYNRLTGEENGKIDRLAGRLALDWRISERFDAGLMLQAGRSDSDVPLFKLAPPFDAQQGSPVVCDKASRGERARDGSCVDLFGQFDSNADIDTVWASNSLGSGIEEDARGLVLTLNWELDDASVTAVTGVDNHKRSEYQDFDASPMKVADNSFDQEIDSFTQELRIASSGDQSIYWIAGAFYSNDTLENLQRLQADDFFGFPGGHINIEWQMDTESYAAFGQAEFPLAESWELVAGLRYTYEERTFEGGTTPVLIPILPVVQADNSIDTDEITGKLGVNFRPSDDVMLYASISKGFKSGGFNGAFATNPVTYTPYGSETLLAYEVGLKSTLLQRRLQFNAAAYYYDWSDFQATVGTIDPLSGLPVQLLTNAGDAEVLGVEADLKWRATDSLTLAWSMAWNDGEIVSGQLDGLGLANNPEFSTNGYVRYEQPVDSLSGALFVQSDFNYRGDYDTRIMTAATRPLVTQEAFWLLNGRAGYLSDDGRVELALWVRNLQDERYLTEVFDQGTINTMDLYSEPRTYGLSITYGF